MNSPLHKYKNNFSFSNGEGGRGLCLCNGTFTSYYNYDAQGNRTRKVVVKGNVKEERYYINGYEVYRKYTNNTLDYELKTLNISDDEKVFVRVEQKTGESEITRYQYDNHLGSACLELDNTGAIISYEEYHPFGTTSYRSGRSETEVSLKRYKYCGKERDEETGLYYYGMRYYAVWICRFVSVDPLQFKYPYYTPYQYAGNKPITFIDLDGAEPFPNPVNELKKMWNYGTNLVKSWFTSTTVKEEQTMKSESKIKEQVLEEPEKSLENNNVYEIKDSKFKEFYPTLLKHEGGYVNHPNDPGGHTNKGITMRTFETYAENLLGIEPTLENLKNITDLQAGAIYEKGYWNGSKAGDVSDKQVAWLYFDTFVNGGGLNVLKSTIEDYGETYSKSSLNKNIKSLNSIIEKHGGENVFNTFKENRAARYERLIENDSKYESFRTGWMNRVNSFVYQKNN